MDLVREEGIQLDALRLKAFPFTKEVEEFIQSHQTVFVIEQNRDAQLRGMLLLELGTEPAKLVPVLNYDGMPITAHAIASQIIKHLSPANSYQNDLPATVI